MADRLTEKTDEYERLLAEAIEETDLAGAGAGGADCLEMATAYLEDGKYFQREDDLPNALASFAYGHGWLDAGIRIGVLVADEEY